MDTKNESTKLKDEWNLRFIETFIFSSNVFLFDTHVMNQFSMDDRDELDQIILAGSKQRDIYRISVGGLSIPAEIRLTVAKSGKTYQILMGYSDAHGLWSEWL